MKENQSNKKRANITQAKITFPTAIQISELKMNANNGRIVSSLFRNDESSGIKTNVNVSNFIHL